MMNLQEIPKKIMPNWVLIEVDRDWDNNIIKTFSGLYIDGSWAPNETAICEATVLAVPDKIIYKARKHGAGRGENASIMMVNPLGSLEAWQEFDIGDKPEVQKGDHVWMRYTSVMNAVQAGCVSKAGGKYRLFVKYDGLLAASRKKESFGVNGKFILDFNVVKEPAMFGGIYNPKVVSVDGKKRDVYNSHIGRVIARPKNLVRDYFWEDVPPDSGMIQNGDIVAAVRSAALESDYIRQNKNNWRYCHNYEIVCRFSDTRDWRYECNNGFVEVMLMENPMSKIVNAKNTKTLMGRIVTTNPWCEKMYGKVIKFNHTDLVPIKMGEMYFTFVRNVRTWTKIGDAEYYVSAR